MPTDLTCQKISETRKEMFQDPDFKARMSAANLGKHHTPEGRANISKGSTGNHKLGTKQTEEAKAKASASLKLAYAEGRHAPSAGLKKGTILGPMSDEEKKKRSDGAKKARQGKFWSTKKKILVTEEKDSPQTEDPA